MEKTLDEAIRAAQNELGRKEKANAGKIKKERRESYKDVIELIRSGNDEDLDIALEKLEESKQTIRKNIRMIQEMESHPSSIEYLEIGRAKVRRLKQEEKNKTGKDIINAEPLCFES